MRSGTLTLCTPGKETRFDIWVPEGRPEQRRGLQGYESLLTKKRGMLFLPEMLGEPHDGTISMRMAGVRVPLAILWFRSGGVLRRVEVVAPGDPRGFSEEAEAVLEIRADAAARLELIPEMSRATWSVR